MWHEKEHPSHLNKSTTPEYLDFGAQQTRGASTGDAPRHVSFLLIDSAGSHYQEENEL